MSSPVYNAVTDISEHASSSEEADAVRVASLLCSRLCHDLVSSVGAVNNGVELLREGHDDLMLDAVELIANSGQVAVRRIAFFRLAFGMGGQGAQIMADARAAAMGFFALGRSDLIWDDAVDLEPFADVSLLPKILLNLLFIGDEALIRGGQMLLEVDSERKRISLRLTGRDPKIQDDHRLVLAGQVPVGRLDPRTVPFYMALQLFRGAGLCFVVDPHGPGRLDLHLVRG